MIERAEIDRDTVASTTISHFELLSPIYQRRLHSEERAVKSFIRQTLMLGVDSAAAEEASQIMGSLLRLGRPINALDTLIGGIAVSNGGSAIITSDHDFEAIGQVADIKIHLI